MLWSGMSWPPMSNGDFPASISYNSTPKAHQSTEKPVGVRVHVCVCVAHIMLHALNGCFLATVVCVLIGQQLAGSGAMGK